MEKTFWNTQVELIKAMGPPVRPHSSEISAMRAMAGVRFNRWPADDRIKVLILGVTPEIIEMDWPPGTEITAVDQSESMIEAFWPGDVAGQRRLVRADWMALPFEAGEFNFVLGDNVFNVFDYPQGFSTLADRLSKIIRPEGLLIVRVLLQAQPIEDGYAIVEEYNSGQLTDYQQFRYRMMTSSQVSAEEGLHTSKELIDKTMEEHGLSMAEVYERTGYRPPRPPGSAPDATSTSMAAYKVSYPTVDEFATAVGHRFRVVASRLGDHPLSHRTPVFALERKA